MNLLRIGDNAPDFKVKGFLHGQVGEYSLGAGKGKWLVLFFYPADFTFICPTEVTGFSKADEGIRRGGCLVWGVSVDSLDSHKAWSAELGGLDCPLLSDETKSFEQRLRRARRKSRRRVARDVYRQSSGVICYQVVSHVNVGRSVEETLRVLKALRTERLCPSDWKPGEATGDLALKY